MATNALASRSFVSDTRSRRSDPEVVHWSPRGEILQTDTLLNLYRSLEDYLSVSAALVQFMAAEGEFVLREAELKRLSSLDRGWDTYDAEPPSSEARKQAFQFLGYLRTPRLVPSKVLPSGEGGVALSFYSENGRDAYIEFLNDGNNKAVLYTNSGEFGVREVEVTPEGASYLAELIREHRSGSSK